MYISIYETREKGEQIEKLFHLTFNLKVLVVIINAYARNEFKTAYIDFFSPFPKHQKSRHVSVQPTKRYTSLRVWDVRLNTF